MLKNLKKLLKDEEGATALEYGLIAAAIAGVIITVSICSVARSTTRSTTSQLTCEVRRAQDPDRGLARNRSS